MHMHMPVSVTPRHVLSELAPVRIVLGVVQQAVVDVGVACAAPHGQVAEGEGERVLGGAVVVLHVTVDVSAAGCLK